MNEKSFSRRKPGDPPAPVDGPSDEEAAELKALEELITKSPMHGHALLIQANLRIATALEDILDVLEDHFPPSNTPT